MQGCRRAGADALALVLQFEGAQYRVIAEARSAFEPLIARLAAERISPDLLKTLEQSVVDMEDRLADINTYLESNERFHNVIALASGNALFGFLIDAMVGSMDISGTAHGIEYPVRRRKAVLSAHRRIYDPIEQGDADNAEDSMKVHIDEHVAYVSRKFPHAMDRLITWE